MEAIDTDVCIVGSGVAGIAIARKLSSASIRTVLLESGSRTENPLSRALSKGEHVGTPYWALDFTRTRRFGGCSDMWFLELMDGRKGLRLRPLDRLDFEPRSEIPNSGWPIPYDEVESYFAEAEILFDIGRGEQWDPPKNDSHFGLDTPEIRTINFRFSPGELFSSKYYEELQKGSVQILLESTVLKLNVSDDGGCIESLTVRRPDGSEFIVTARKVVLACGGLENPRLMLLSSETGSRPLGSSTDNIGRYFMEHPHFLSGIVIPANRTFLQADQRYVKHGYDGATQISKIAPSESLVRKHGLLNFCMHLSPSSRSSTNGIHQSKAYDAIRILRSYAVGKTVPVELRRYLIDIISGIPELAAKSVRRVASRIGRNQGPTHFDLYHMSEQIPNRDSRVVLGNSRDFFGQPRARLEWRLTSEDISRVLSGQKLIQAGLERTGEGRFVSANYGKLPPPGIRGGYHHMGTTRMSVGPEKGVVDGDCKVHGMENLFVAGSSVFPTSGYANPTFTIGALSLRLGDHLLKI